MYELKVFIIGVSLLILGIYIAVKFDIDDWGN